MSVFRPSYPRAPGVARVVAAAVVWVVGWLVGPSRMSAQEIRGLVSYTHNGFPVAQATLRLLTLDGEIVATTSSGWDGAFRLKAPSPGDYEVHVEHLTALDMLDGPIRIEGAAVAVVSYQVVPQAFALDEIRVEVESRSLPLARTGFYGRRQAGMGHFMGPAELEDRGAQRTTDLFWQVPGMRVLTQNGVVGGIGAYPVTNYSLRSRFIPGFCYPRVFIDGVLSELGGRQAPQASFDQLVRPDELLGMEVYSSPAETPAQYAGAGDCGVILVWTKR